MPETNELRRLLEAILFASARAMNIQALARLCKRSENDVLAALTLWKKELEEANSPTILEEEKNGWKLTVREKYIPVVKKVVTKTELPKTILETLAIVAYKAPVLQSKVVKLRTNKAYDHLSYLEQAGFISREKHGRTKMIKLTPKFYDYFSIDPTKLRGKFKKMGDIETAIEAKEKEHEELEKAREKEARETYDTAVPVEELEPTGVETYKETLGELEIYSGGETEADSEKPAEKKRERKKEKKKEMPAKKKEAESEAKKDRPKLTPEEKLAREVEKIAKKAKRKEFTTKGLYPEGVPPEVEEKVEKRVKEILEGEKE